MSFTALALAVDAAHALEPLEDDEFGLTWPEIDWAPDLDVDWVLYRSAGAGLILGVRSVVAVTP